MKYRVSNPSGYDNDYQATIGNSACFHYSSTIVYNTWPGSADKCLFNILEEGLLESTLDPGLDWSSRDTGRELIGREAMRDCGLEEPGREGMAGRLGGATAVPALYRLCLE